VKHAEPQSPAASPPYAGWYAAATIMKGEARARWAAWLNAPPSGDKPRQPDASGEATSLDLALADADGALRNLLGRSALTRQIDASFAGGRRRRATRAPPVATEPVAAPHTPRSRHAFWQARSYWRVLGSVLVDGYRPPQPSEYGFAREPDPPDDECKAIAARWPVEVREAAIRAAEQARQRRIDELIRKAVEDWWRAHATGEHATAAPRYVGAAAGREALAGLGLSERCSEPDIKRAFRRLIAEERLHPDQGGDPVRFREAVERCALALGYLESRGASATAHPEAT